MSSVTVVVASHKPYEMPRDRVTYLPVEVGSACRSFHIDGFQRDDQGENISEKNPSYCELTALYWAWKNSDADILGLAHYRRHFCPGTWTGIESVMSQEEILSRLRHSELILPKKRHYVIETISSHYKHTHENGPLEICRQVVQQESPEYAQALDEVFDRRSAHMFNMLIGHREVVGDYCSWLFDVLGRIEQQIDITPYSDKEKRVFGYVSEILLDVWIEVNQLNYVEVPVHHLEGEKWLRKGPQFVRSKISGTVMEVMGVR